MKKIIISEYQDKLTLYNKFLRFIWSLTWLILARPLPRRSFRFWKIFLLKLFGAKIKKNAVVYASAKIHMPWNLELGMNSCIGPQVDCYNIDKITIGDNVVISQKVYLCTASHDINDKYFKLITKPIQINDHCWIAADSFISMGVIIGTGSVVGARSCVYKNIGDYQIVGGNPAKFLKKRKIN